MPEVSPTQLEFANCAIAIGGTVAVLLALVLGMQFVRSLWA